MSASITDHFSKAERLISDMIASTDSIKPVAVITYGPTGSGKASILRTVLDHAHPEQIRKWGPLLRRGDGFNYVPILQDDVMLGFEEYRVQIEEMKASLKDINITDSDIDQMATGCFDSETAKKLLDLSKKFGDIYQSFLPYTYLLTGYLVDTCVTNRRNLLIETTGNNTDYLDSTIKKLKTNGYYIVILYPIARLTTIYRRVINRAKTEGRLVALEFVKVCYKNSYINFRRLSQKADESYLVCNDETIVPAPTPTVVFRLAYVDYQREDYHHASAPLLAKAIEEESRHYPGTRFSVGFLYKRRDSGVRT